MSKKAVKKSVAKKTAAKKPVAKRAAPKKAAVKKAVAKKTVAKKTLAKKGPAKRAAATPAASSAPKAKVATPRLPADLKLAIKCAQDKQAIDLTVLDLRKASAFTDFFVVCTGANTKQVQAIADAIEAGLKADGQPAALVEGYNRGEWILLDYFTFIVHVFLPAQRTFYALERLWGGAEPIEVSAS
jgi:ribosome-associated protein